MLIPQLSALFETSLSAALAADGTTFTIVSSENRDGNNLSGLYAFIIDEGTADEEFFVGNVISTTVEIIYRGCDSSTPADELEANKKAHRRGASVKITDYPVLGFIRNALAGETGYELHTFLKMASGAGLPTDDKHLTTKEYVDDAVSAGTGIPNKIIVAGNAGETVSAGQLIYFDDSDNEWKLCDADSAASVENSFLGIAQGAGVNGGAISNGVLIFGVDANQSGLTIGAVYYASNTAGAISSSPGTKEVSIGWGKSATELYFCPRFNQQLTEDQQDALAGKSGTAPSNSNKFEDESDTSPTSSANKLVRAGSDGKIDQGFIKTSKKILVSTTEVTFTNGNGGAGAGTEQTLFSTTVPANTLSTNNGIDIDIFLNDVNMDQAAGAYVFRIKYGGSTVLTLTSKATGGSNLSGMTGKLKAYILADAATNAQKVIGEVTLMDNGSSTAEANADAAVSMDKQHFSSVATSAIDSTADQTLTITLQTTNDADNDCVVESCIIRTIA